MEGISLVERARTRRALAVERLTVLRILPQVAGEDQGAEEPRPAPLRRLSPAAISPFTGLGCRKLIEPYRDPRGVFRNSVEPNRKHISASIPLSPARSDEGRTIDRHSAGGEPDASDLTPPPARPAPRDRQVDMAKLLLQQVRQ